MSFAVHLTEDAARDLEDIVLPNTANVVDAAKKALGVSV